MMIRDFTKSQGNKFMKWLSKNLALFIIGNIVWILLVLVFFVIFTAVFGAIDIVGTDTSSESNKTNEIGTLYKSSPLQPPYTITEEFGAYTGGEAGFGFHYGTDFSAYYGANVYSVLNGTVLETNNGCSSISWSCGGEYGNYVYIEYQLDNETIYVMYGHLERVHVLKGQRVAQGQVIGLQGNSGKSTGTHLHFEVRTENTSNRSARVNPRNYFEF